MSISFTPLFNRLHTESENYNSARLNLGEEQRQKALLEKFHSEIQRELKTSDSFSFENNQENKRLIDEIYALGLLEGEPVYSFEDTDQLISVIQDIQSIVQSKALKIQDDNQLNMKQRQELMDFYNTLLDLINKISQTVQNTISRIH